MPTSAPTITDLKSAFLRTQILALQKPLRPTPEFASASISSSENALRQKSIDEALHKLNARLREHNQRAYAPQAQRHVAEQIDRLYWSKGERPVVVGGEADWLARGSDYRSEDVIEKMPEEWSEDVPEKARDDANRYRELQERLVGLNERRKMARERVELYRAVKELLDPFEGEDAKLQDNLVTKNGEVEKELEKMRMLMLRVERGLMGLREGGGDEMVVDIDIDVDEDDRKKLLSLIGQ